MHRLACLLIIAALVPAAAAANPDPREISIGAQALAQMTERGEIVARPNAGYTVLDPIAARISAAAAPFADVPISFVLVHRPDADAFGIPGGIVYVTDSMLSFAQNQDELAAYMCHETAHIVQHDLIRQIDKRQRVLLSVAAAGALSGAYRTYLGRAGEAAAYNQDTASFWAQAEMNADVTGSDICAEAGYNPWAMIWLFANFERSPVTNTPESLADHLTDTNRAVALRKHFDEHPELYGGYSSDIATGKPIPAY